MNRRKWLKSVSTLGVLSFLSSTNNVVDAATLFKRKGLVKLDQKALLAERKKARQRQRRIIMNNDGDDVYMDKNSAGTYITPEAFLNRRTSPLLNSQVDTFSYSTGMIGLYSHESKVTEQHRNERAQNTIKCFREIGTDTLSIITNWCHQHNKEVFWATRMNDHHDVGNPELRAQVKTDHPEYLVGTEGVKSKYMPTVWTAYNYNVPEVRKFVLDIITDVVTRYDVDGIDLDFWKHPHFFKEQFLGIPITQEQCDLMTQLIRDIRSACDKVSLERNKPILIAVHIPDSVGFCKAIGLDIEKWLQEDLIDIMSGCNYFKLEPWENWVALGKKYNVPVYAGLDQRRWRNEVKGKEENLARWRGEAYLAWKAGVDGIYTYNLFNPQNELYRQIGDIEILDKLPRIDKIAYIGKGGYNNPDYWVMNGGSYYRNSENKERNI